MKVKTQRSTSAIIFSKLKKPAIFIQLSIGLQLLLFSAAGNAQSTNDFHSVQVAYKDSAAMTTKKLSAGVDDYNNRLDMIDIGTDILHDNICGKRADTGVYKSKKLRISAGPSPEYSLATGYAMVVAGNAGFFIDTSASTSTIYNSITYTQYNQVILPFETSLFTKNNNYNIIIDWCYYYYPSYTYGLGCFTTLSDGYIVTYSAYHIHQTVLRKVRHCMYAGLGYNLDYFNNISEQKKPDHLVTDFDKYGFAQKEFSSGITCNFLYDTRPSPINSDKGDFVNIICAQNLRILGNTNPWTSLVIDMRKYLRFPANSSNVIAFWSYDWLTLNGKPPYLMLPFNGGDAFSNTGRGYIQGRFRGRNMIDLESEYRMAISRNGLLGAVVFANAESFSEPVSGKLQGIAPGAGAGIRVKFNKFSNANVALDYAFGLDGSHGVFVNLGEVF